MSYKGFIQNVIGNRASKLVKDNAEAILGLKLRDLVYLHNQFDKEGDGFVNIESDRSGSYDFYFENYLTFATNEIYESPRRGSIKFAVNGTFSEYGVLVITRISFKDSDGNAMKMAQHMDLRVD